MNPILLGPLTINLETSDELFEGIACSGLITIAPSEDKEILSSSG